jgi:hypothetical protein
MLHVSMLKGLCGCALCDCIAIKGASWRAARINLHQQARCYLGVDKAITCFLGSGCVSG